MDKISGIVERVTFYSEQTGWSVLKVQPFNRRGELVTVTVHQAKVFAGASADFFGNWHQHSQYGEQFKATRMEEKKPSSSAALEKYLGSGLIYGVGPKTAKKIVKYFKEETLEVFEEHIERLREVPGIAKKKLISISKSWEEHREIRNVMMFLQKHGISTLFAVKIYKQYGNNSISIVEDNPYQLSNDIYGIGFLSADKIASSLGIVENDPKRIKAAIKFVLAKSRDEGHCYLKLTQICQNITELLDQCFDQLVEKFLKQMDDNNKIKSRVTDLNGEFIVSKKRLDSNDQIITCYYSKTLFFDEDFVAKKVKSMICKKNDFDQQRILKWIDNFNQSETFSLSKEQSSSVAQIVQKPLAVLTGGPGCGKTTTTKAIVKLLIAMKKVVLLAAPTGRAAQRMEEVIGLPAKTLHRLLVWNPSSGGFKKNEDEPLEADYIIIDECSMLDISLSASLFKAIDQTKTNLLLIGDKDQLPSVGAGNVFKDFIESNVIPTFKLTQVFRQAKESLIIKYAHQINEGVIPLIDSPFRTPNLWSSNADAFFIDSEEATQKELSFLYKFKKFVKENQNSIEINNNNNNNDNDPANKILSVDISEQEIANIKNGKTKYKSFDLPDKFKHISIEQLLNSSNEIEEIKHVIKKVHPFSTLNYGYSASDMIVKLFKEIIPKYLGSQTEIQILSPMTRGSMGTIAINQRIQRECNPPNPEIKEISFNDKIFRCQDRVIQKRNNYDLEVFNGDIGTIVEINLVEMELKIAFPSKKGELVTYKKEHFIELDLAYAITIHKSQGSEFDSVIIPVTTQHFKLLSRNLIYTGLTRAKKNLVFIGTRKALAMAVKNIDHRTRQTLLRELIICED